jgi:transcriptional regulator with XRE-family HTH domain
LNRKRINPTRSEGQDGDIWARLLADVQGHIWAYRDFNKLAQAANLSVATVSNLAHGDTKSPHMRTVARIMHALGKSDPILEAFKSEKPMTESALAKHWISRQKMRAARKAKIRIVSTRVSVRRQKGAAH